MTVLHGKWVKANENLKHCYQLLHPSMSMSTYEPSPNATCTYDKAKRQEEKAKKAYMEQVNVGKALGGTGSGKVLLVLLSQ